MWNSMVRNSVDTRHTGCPLAAPELWRTLEENLQDETARTRGFSAYEIGGRGMGVGEGGGEDNTADANRGEKVRESRERLARASYAPNSLRTIEPVDKHLRYAMS